MGLNLTNFTNILKIDYQGPIREQITQNNVLLSNLKQDVSREMFHGKQAYLPLHTGRNVGVGVRAETATLPTAGAQQYSNAVYNMSYIYGAIAVTGQTIAASRDNTGAFARALESEMSGLVNDISHNMNRQLWHDGTGLLCDVVSNSTGTVTVTDTKFLQVGMPVTIAIRASGSQSGLTAASATNVAIATVPSATTFTLAESPGTCTTTMGVYLHGSRNLTDWDQPYEMWGLEAIVTDQEPAEEKKGIDGTAEDGFTSTYAASGTNVLGGILRSANSFWQANVIDSDTWDVDLLDLQQAFDTTEIESEQTPGLLLTSHAVRRHYAKQLTDLRRFGNEVVLKGGWKGVEFNGSAIIADKWASTANDPANTALTDFDRIYLVSPSALEFQILQELEWEDTGGVVVRSAVGANAVDEVSAYMKAYMNLCATRPNACTLLHGIT
jgi:hypothetical protein